MPPTRAHVLYWQDVEADGGASAEVRRARWLTCLRCKGPVSSIESCDEDRDHTWRVIASCHDREEGRSISTADFARSPMGTNPLSLVRDWRDGFAFQEFRTPIHFETRGASAEPSEHEALCIRAAVESAICESFVVHGRGIGGFVGDAATRRLRDVAIERFRIRYNEWSASVEFVDAPETTSTTLRDGSVIIGNGGRSYRLAPSTIASLPLTRLIPHERVEGLSPIEDHFERVRVGTLRFFEVLRVCLRAWCTAPALLELDAMSSANAETETDDTALRFSLLELDHERKTP